MKLSSEQKLKLKEFARQNGIKFVVLFGSRAQSKAGDESDFDIAVLTSEEKNIFELENYNNVLTGLSKILKIPDYKTDLTNLNNANIFLRYEIVSRGELLYGEETDYLEFKSFALKDYIDAEELRRLEDFLIKKKQRLILEAI